MFRADVNELRTAHEVLRVFLNLDDEAIVNRARLIDFPGIDVPDYFWYVVFLTLFEFCFCFVL